MSEATYHPHNLYNLKQKSNEAFTSLCGKSNRPLKQSLFTVSAIYNISVVSSISNDVIFKPCTVCSVVLDKITAMQLIWSHGNVFTLKEPCIKGSTSLLALRMYSCKLEEVILHSIEPKNKSGSFAKLIGISFLIIFTIQSNFQQQISSD